MALPQTLIDLDHFLADEPLEQPVWTLDEAVKLVRTLQGSSRVFNYHLAIGGGVLNYGSSYKDLDLYFLSMNNKKPTNPKGMLRFLENFFKETAVPLSAASYGPSPFYTHKVKFENNGKRIDAFIV